jgi:hypothetical protein
MLSLVPYLVACIGQATSSRASSPELNARLRSGLGALQIV